MDIMSLLGAPPREVLPNAVFNKNCWVVVKNVDHKYITISKAVISKMSSMVPNYLRFTRYNVIENLLLYRIAIKTMFPMLHDISDYCRVNINQHDRYSKLYLKITI